MDSTFDLGAAHRPLHIRELNNMLCLAHKNEIRWMRSEMFIRL